MGCATANLRHDFSRTVERGVADLEPAALAGIMREQQAEGEARLAAFDAPITRIRVSHAGDMAYLGQIHTLRVPIKPGWTSERMAAAFHEAYRAEFGNTLGGIPVVLINVRTTVEGVRHRKEPKAELAPSRAAPRPHGRRRVHFGAWVETPVHWRHDLLPGTTLAGPAIIEQPDTTTVVPAGMRVRVDGWRNLVMEAA
jgi:N-methylhydantoinase A